MDKRISQQAFTFVLSTGRVGTQTLAEVFKRSPDLAAFHEPRPTLFHLSKSAFDAGSDALYRDQIFKEFLKLRMPLFETVFGSGHQYVETSPQVTFLAEALRENLPRCRFIHLVRNPRDVVKSGLIRQWYEGHPLDSHRIIAIKNNWHNLDPIQKISWLWVETNRWINEFSKTCSANQFIRINSEKIYSGEKATLKNIFDFLQIDIPSAKSINEVLSQKLNANKPSEKPLAWGPDEEVKMAAITGEWAKILGYDS